MLACAHLLMTNQHTLRLAAGLRPARSRAANMPAVLVGAHNESWQGSQLSEKVAHRADAQQLLQQAARLIKALLLLQRHGQQPRGGGCGRAARVGGGLGLVQAAPERQRLIGLPQPPAQLPQRQQQVQRAWRRWARVLLGFHAKACQFPHSVASMQCGMLRSSRLSMGLFFTILHT